MEDEKLESLELQLRAEEKKLDIKNKVLEHENQNFCIEFKKKYFSEFKAVPFTLKLDGFKATPKLYFFSLDVQGRKSKEFFNLREGKYLEVYLNYYMTLCNLKDQFKINRLILLGEVAKLTKGLVFIDELSLFIETQDKKLKKDRDLVIKLRSIIGRKKSAHEKNPKIREFLVDG